jgi:hypothetical protein
MSVKGVTSTQSMPGTMVPHDKIAMRAYEKWCKRGRPHGTDKQDWMEAERELREEYARTGGSPSTRR